MWNNFLKEKIYCGLDIGSHKIKASLLKLKANGELEVLNVVEKKVQGFKGLSVINLSELSDAVSSLVQEVSLGAHVKVKELELGIGAELVESRMTSAVIPLQDRGNKIIIPTDLKKVNYQAKVLGMKMEEDVLHELTMSYLVDDVNTALNPLGLYGRKLGVESILLLSKINRTRNIIQAVNHAGFDVSHVNLSSYAASEVVLSPQDKSGGCVLVDIGSKTSSLLVFKDGVLQAFEKIMIGGEQFTAAICSHLNLTYDLAEEIKKSYAVALDTDPHLSEEILIKKESSYIPIKREVIYQAINGEIIRFADSIRSVLSKNNWQDQLNQGMVFIGGASLLTGLIERLGKELGQPVRLGKISLTSKTLMNAANVSCAVGLSYAHFLKSSKSNPSQMSMTLGKKISHRIRELYEEYF